MPTTSPIFHSHFIARFEVLKYILALIFTVNFLSLSAQQIKPGTASAMATANIVTGMVGADRLADMTFESIQMNSPGAKKTAPVVSGTASFNIIGEYAYSVTIPGENILVTNKDNFDTMQVGRFSFTTERNGLTSNEQRIIISADLNVKSLQSPGNYGTDTPLVVTVNYN